MKILSLRYFQKWVLAASRMIRHGVMARGRVAEPSATQKADEVVCLTLILGTRRTSECPACTVRERQCWRQISLQRNKSDMTAKAGDYKACHPCTVEGNLTKGSSPNVLA